MKLIHLRGQYSHIACKVDDEDYDDLKKFNWFYNYAGYAVRNVWINKKRKSEYMHRRVMKAQKGQLIDHINRDTFDNQTSNLRISDKSRNGFNGKPRKDNTSGTRGVYWNKKQHKWNARITISGKEISLGYHVHKGVAIAARRKAENKYVKF